MAVRGTIAKTNVENMIKAAFGNAYVGIHDKKLYVLADDGGQQVQIAITLTCPKTGIEASEEPEYAGFVEETTIEFTPEEEQTIETLLKKYNL